MQHTPCLNLLVDNILSVTRKISKNYKKENKKEKKNQTLTYKVKYSQFFQYSFS